jgi:hypothetical protein
MEFRVIVDQPRNGEASIRDELTVCRWEGAWIGGNCDSIIMIKSICISLKKGILFILVLIYVKII